MEPRFKNKSKVFYHLYIIQQENIRMKTDLETMKMKISKQLAFFVDYFTKNLTNFKFRIHDTRMECLLCNHE